MSKEMVTLKAKDSKGGVKKTFVESQALKLLKLPNSQWELADEKYSYDGKDLSKKGK